MRPETIDIILWIVFFIIPWLIGTSVTLAWVWTKYWDWLWKGMDEDHRYRYIRVRDYDNSSWWGQS